MDLAMTDGPPPAVGRLWKGTTRVEDGEAYADFLRRTGLPGYRGTPGNRGVVGLRRIRGGAAEFLLLSLWDSREAIARFAGPRIGRALFYDGDDRWLVRRGPRVGHFDLIFEAGFTESAAG